MIGIAELQTDVKRLATSLHRANERIDELCARRDQLRAQRDSALRDAAILRKQLILMGDYTDAEIEDDRQIDLQKACERTDMSLASLEERYCSELGYREVLHLSFVFAENVASYLAEHPAVAFDPEAYQFTSRALDALYELYQRIDILEENVRVRAEAKP